MRRALTRIWCTPSTSHERALDSQRVRLSKLDLTTSASAERTVIPAVRAFLFFPLLPVMEQPPPSRATGWV